MDNMLNMKSLSHIKKYIVIITGLMLLISISLYSQEQPSPPSETQRKGAVPPIKKIGKGLFEVGGILINKNEISITFPAIINMEKGIIEYAIVRSTGKTHESLLRTNIDPFHLNICFLLLGFKGSNNPLNEQGASEIPGGDKLEIYISYNTGNANKTVKMDSFIEKEDGEGRSHVSLNWVYTGSLIVQGTFLAQEQGSIAAVYHDPTALIDHTTPGGDSDEIWFVNGKTTPHAGTHVKVIIKGK